MKKRILNFASWVAKKIFRELYNSNREILANQMLSFAILDSVWLKHKDFTPGSLESAAMDGYALHNLYRILNDVNPQNILEFGLGQSSKLVHQYANFFKANAVTVEHDKNWIDAFCKHARKDISFNIKQFNLMNAKINGKETLTYENMESLQEKFDFIIVDAPFGYNQKYYARTQILDFIPQRLSENFCIFIHDSERGGEQATIKLLCEKLNLNSIAFHIRNYVGIKNHTVVCSENWKFLASI